ncbi:MAG: hypothetical protein DRN71_02075 [Candidatus Nanohalarchaeota archaeon]|nr:MAG: hypothetical protein DRN71_02075 [Candidatus Nanohaloarchaeota archaeon]
MTLNKELAKVLDSYKSALSDWDSNDAKVVLFNSDGLMIANSSNTNNEYADKISAYLYGCYRKIEACYTELSEEQSNKEPLTITMSSDEPSKYARITKVTDDIYFAVIANKTHTIGLASIFAEDTMEDIRQLFLNY